MILGRPPTIESGTGNVRCSCGRQRPCFFHRHHCRACGRDVTNLGWHWENECTGKESQ